MKSALAPWLENKRHIIWDWNGTLLADVDHAVVSVNQLLRENELPEVTVDGYRQTFGFPVIDYYKKLGFNTEREVFLKLCDRFSDIFHAGMKTCELWPGVHDTLKDLRNSGKMQSVLSASEQILLNQSLRDFHIHHLFDHIVGTFDKTASSKVERGLFLLQQVDIPLAETVMIGDTDHDLEVGETMGIDVILVDHGHQHPMRLHEVHHTVVKVF